MSGRPGKVVLALSSIIAILLAECSDNGLFFNVTKQHKPTVNVFFQSKKNKELLKSSCDRLSPKRTKTQINILTRG